MRSRFGALLPLGMAVLAVVLAFHPVLFNAEHGLFYRDHSLHFLPTKYLWLKNMLAEGQVPRWNYYYVGGIPFYADISLSPLWPLNWIFLVTQHMEFARAYVFYVSAHYFFLFLTAYFLMRAWLPARGMAFALALCAAIGGAPMSNSSSIMIVGASIGMYLTLGAWVRWQRTLDWQWLIVAAIGIAIPVYSGEAQYGYVLGLMLVPWEFFGRLSDYQKAGREQGWKASFAGRILALFSVAILAFLFAAPQVLPTIQMVLESKRGFSHLGFANSMVWSLDPRRWLDFFFVAPFGNFDPEMTYLAAQWRGNLFVAGQPFTFSFYIGILGAWGFLLYLLSQSERIYRRKQWQLLLPIGSAAFFFLILLGRFSWIPVYEWCWKFIPLWNAFRYPERLASFLVALLLAFAAIGWRRFFLLQKESRRHFLFYTGFVAAIVFILSGATGLWIYSFSEQFPQAMLSTAAFSALVGLILVAGEFKRWSPLILSFVLLGIATVDLSVSARQMLWDLPISLSRIDNYVIPAAVRASEKKRAAELEMGGARRVFNLDPFHTGDSFLRAQGMVSYLTITSLWHWEHIVPSTLAYFDIESFDAYDPFSNQRLVDLQAMLEKNRGRLVDVLGVYYVVRADSDVPEKLNVEENLSALPYAYVATRTFAAKSQENFLATLQSPHFIEEHWAVVKNQGEQEILPPVEADVDSNPAPQNFAIVEMQERRSDRVHFHIVMKAKSENSLFVWNESFNSNWKPKIGGKSFPLVETNFWAMGVHLPAMKNGEACDLDFVYEDPNILRGQILFIFGIFLAGLLFWKTRRKGMHVD